MDNTENKYVCFVMYDTDMNDDKFFIINGQMILILIN